MGDDRDKQAAQADLELSPKEAEDVKGGSAEAKRRKRRKKGGSGASGSATNKPM